MIVSKVTRVSLLWTFDEPRWLCEANEVISLSMDNIWRSTQLFYISAPLLLYSIIKGGVVKAYYCTLRAFVFFSLKYNGLPGQHHVPSFQRLFIRVSGVFLL